MKFNPSRDQLGKSTERRIKSLMIRTLEKFEGLFPDIDNSHEGQLFKGDIRNIFNDAIRAQRSEFDDYSIEYRPLRINPDNTLAITQSFIQTIQAIEFGFTPCDEPFFRLMSTSDHLTELDAIRSEIETGVLYEIDGKYALEVVGLQSCIDNVLPCFDRYAFHVSLRPKYRSWRQAVINKYKE